MREFLQQGHQAFIRRMIIDAIEGGTFPRIDFTLLLDQLKDRQDRPTAAINLCVEMAGSNARNVFDEAATSQVRQCFDR
jgi:hypothetical protein